MEHAMRRRLLLSTLALPAMAQPSRMLVASFSILGDMLRELAPEGADIRVLVGANTDAHGFQPRPSHTELMRGAALALSNGLGFDAWFERILRASGFRGTLVTASEGIVPRPARQTAGHSHGGLDPHAWQDVSLARQYARRIATGLAAIGLRHNRDAYDSELAGLNAWIHEQISQVPPARRVVLTSHDSFGYFGAAYGVRFLAPQGVSTSAEPSAQAMGNLIRQIRGLGISAVFMENIGNSSNLQRLAQEAGVRVSGRLYADALSQPDGPAPTYTAMMRHNVTLLVAAMKG